ncbi:DNA helicase [Trifolium repens]|nr:DNA helicase [Trifolium repens]
MDRPDYVWQKSWHWLCDIILYKQRQISQNQELTLTDEELQHLTHIEIEKHMQVNSRSLRQFKCLPYPEGYVTPFLGNRLIYEERNYDPVEKDLIYQQLSASMTDEQRDIFEQIMEAVNNQKDPRRSKRIFKCGLN